MLKGAWSSLWRQPLNRKLGVAVALAVAALLLARNGWIFDTPTTESGDFAANSILVDYAKSGRWFAGHYSRFGFYHPGPFFLYVQTFGELFFFDWLHLVPSQFNGQVLALLLFNAGLIGVATSVVGKNLNSAWLALWTPLFLVALAVMQPQALSSTWEPLFVILPYTLMIIVSASVLGGNTSHLPIAVFSFGLLFHAHAGFLFAGSLPFLALVSVLGWQILRRGVRVARRTWAWCAVVAVAFALPIVINTIIHWPGEFPRYLKTAGSEEVVSRTVGQAVGFVAGVLNLGAGVQVLVFVGLVIATIGSVLGTSRKVQPFFWWILVFCAVGVAVVVSFSYLTIRDLSKTTEVYLIWYGIGIPILVVMVATFATLDWAQRSRRLVAALAAVGAVGTIGVVLAAPGISSDYRGTPEVAVATARIESQVPGDVPVILSFDQEGWPVAAGVFEQLRRDGRATCIAATRDPWKTLFTSRQVCTNDELSRGRRVSINGSSKAGAQPAAEPIGANLYVVIAP